jgi:hypothetical protein
MALWSPETTHVMATDDAPLRVGARFTGSNRRGRYSWSTSCRVVESKPGEAFAFEVTYGPLAVSRWRYAVRSQGGGCEVEEQWWDRRGRVMRLLSRLGTGVSDRAEHNRVSMRQTLQAMKSDLESDPTVRES